MSFIKNKENIERQLHKNPQNFRLKPILTFKIDLSIPISEIYRENKYFLKNVQQIK